MFSKIVILSTLLALAVAHPGGIVPIGGVGTPAATTLVAGPAPIAYAAAPAPILHAAPALPLAAAPAPIVHAAPAVAYAAAPAVAIPAPVTYTTGVKVAHVYQPVEQHGYKIAY